MLLTHKATVTLTLLALSSCEAKAALREACVIIAFKRLTKLTRAALMAEKHVVLLPSS